MTQALIPVRCMAAHIPQQISIPCHSLRMFWSNIGIICAYICLYIVTVCLMNIYCENSLFFVNNYIVRSMDNNNYINKASSRYTCENVKWKWPLMLYGHTHADNGYARKYCNVGNNIVRGISLFRTGTYCILRWWGDHRISKKCLPVYEQEHIAYLDDQETIWYPDMCYLLLIYGCSKV